MSVANAPHGSTVSQAKLSSQSPSSVHLDRHSSDTDTLIDRPSGLSAYLGYGGEAPHDRPCGVQIYVKPLQLTVHSLLGCTDLQKTPES